MATNYTDTPAKLAYSPAEAMQVLGVSRSTIYKLLRSGEIPCIRLGEKRFIVPVEELKNWLTHRAECGQN